MRKIIKFIKVLCIIFLIALILFVAVGFLDTRLKLTKYTYKSEKVPESMDGYKILQISDLHHKNFGKHQKNLINMVKDAKPDIIVLTGDIVDKNHEDIVDVMYLIKEICDVAPIYYVTGNHEQDSNASANFSELRALFEEYGVIDLCESSVKLDKDNEVTLYGHSYQAYGIANSLERVEKGLNILIYHDSTTFDITSQYGFDIIFAGHSHGGIIRIPFVGGVCGNSGEYFPKYAGGRFEENGTTMFASKGLGDAQIPRFYNPPEVVLVTLKHK